MNIVFFGTPSFVIPVLRILKDNFDLIAVVTAPDKKKGRDMVLSPSPIKTASETWDIPIFTPEKLDSVFTEQIKKLQPDIMITAAYGKLLPLDLLNLPQYGSLNVHPSLLPKYRGTTPIQSAMIEGEEITGVTLYKMDEKMDHGPIIAQKKERIVPTDTDESLHYRLFEIGAKLLAETLPQYLKNPTMLYEQDHTNASFTKRLKRESGFIDISSPPSKEKIQRMIKALYPWPGVWTYLPMTDGTTQIIKFLPQERVQIEGKKPMSYKDFLNGYPEGKEILPILQMSNTTNNK